jgi:hypothetical protein
MSERSQTGIVCSQLKRTATLLLLSFALGLACVGGPAVGERADTSSLALNSTTTIGNGFTRVDIEQRGAISSVILPDNWNGDLVSIVHGFVDPIAPVGSPTSKSIIDMELFATEAVDLGFGVAMSSWRENGAAYRDARTDIIFAETLFTVNFGLPEHRIIAATSAGGHVQQRLVESRPFYYDGQLSISAGLGGTTAAYSHFLHARALFDYFYPGVLPGSAADAPVVHDVVAEVVLPVVSAVLANPGGAIEWASVSPLDIPSTDFGEILDTAITLMVVHAWVISDINERAGGLPASNMDVVYSGSSDDAALNAGILRYEATPAAAQFARKFDPSGFLPHTKVFALHTARDGAVPVAANLDAYRNLLNPEDRERYAQRLTDSAAHSAYAPGVLGQALTDLASWIAGGPAPSP